MEYCKDLGKDFNYTALFDIASSTGKVAAEEVHKALASGQSYTCKRCHSTLVKYASISAHIRNIQSYLSTKLSTEPSDCQPTSSAALSIAFSRSMTNVLLQAQRAVSNCIPTPFLAFLPWQVHMYDYLPDPSFLASFPVLPRTRFTFTCDNCGGETSPVMRRDAGGVAACIYVRTYLISYSYTIGASGLPDIHEWFSLR